MRYSDRAFLADAVGKIDRYGPSLTGERTAVSLQMAPRRTTATIRGRCRSEIRVAPGDTPEFRMLKRIGIDLQPHVDTIHLAAVETLRETPDAQTIAAGRRALEIVVEHGSISEQTQPVVDAARITEEAFDIVLTQTATAKSRVGHYVAAIVADLSRTIDAMDTGEDPGAFLNHASSLLRSIPRQDEQNLVEIDLNDRDQLALLMRQQNQTAAPAAAPPDVSELRARLAAFAERAELLLDSAEDPRTLDALVDSLLSLQDVAAQSQIEHIGRVVACALRVVESHRSAGEPLPLDAVEFVIACRRIIPMILESLEDPARVSHAVDALVDQSAFVLLELRRGTRPLGNLWPEPNESEYQAINDGHEPPPSDEESESPDLLATDEVEESGNGHATDWTISEFRPDSRTLATPGPKTQALDSVTPTIDVPIERVEQLMRLAGELAVRSGGYHQRARRVLSVSQDINSIGDRLRYLVRAWQDGKYEDQHVQQHLTEITADLGLAAADLDHARNDHIAASDRQAEVRSRLEATISALRSLPLKSLTEPLEQAFDDLTGEYGRKAKLRVEGASNVVEASNAGKIGDTLRHLVMNALEHGIEPPDIREQAGKSPAGLVQIRARRDGSQTVVQVIDDGGGMKQSEILERAEAAGYPVPRREMTRDRILQYIFLPGFTTRPDDGPGEKGMGLDFVSEAVVSASGSITVQSEPGRGTAFTIRLPVAATSMPATIVSISSERYALPAAELEPVDAGRIVSIEETSGGYRATVDNEVIPAADLGALLGVRSHHHVQSERGAFIRVTDDEERWLLRVDRVQESESIALEPLGRQYHPVTGVVGTATLHSGDQANVLDIAQVLDASGRKNRRLSRETASLTKVPFALVSDDSISVRRQISSQLEVDGWRVVEARDAFEARELLETVEPDLIVVDLDLPAHGGFQIAQTARNRGDMPVIGLTAREDPSLRDRATTFEIDTVLVKPLDLDRFAAALQRIDRRHLSAD